MSCRARAREAIKLGDWRQFVMSCRARAREVVEELRPYEMAMSCRARAREEVARNSTGYYKVSHRAREVTQ